MNSYETLEIAQIVEQIDQYAKTSGGHQAVGQLSFIQSRLVLNRELSRQNEALMAVVKQGSPSFAGIHEVSESLILASKGGLLSIEELVRIGQFGRGIANLRRYQDKSVVSFESLMDLFDNLSSDLKLSEAIERCFSNDFEVFDNASPTLSSIRKQRTTIEGRISSAINTFIQKNADYLTENFSTIRSDRSVLPIKTSQKHHFKGIIHGQSASGQTTYVEPQILIDLNNERQSLIVEEHQEIMRICRDLSAKVSVVSDVYLASQETASLLDSLFARGQWAKERNGVVAKLSEGQLILKQARHPLLDQNKVVANNYTMVSPITMILITGPNTGGKTVGLKTIGTSVYLTHCGIPVLCDEAQVPFVDRVFVDIGDKQSIQQSLSTFSSHIQSLKIVIDEASANSLVLLDELGVGTDPLEGESLAQAILETLHQRKVMTVATTHYNQLKLFAKQHDEILNASVEFNVETLQPTYRFIEGIAGQSYALDIAAKLEVNQQVIDRAAAIKQESLTQEELMMEALEKQLLIQQQMNEEIEVLREELKQQRAQLNKEYETIDKTKAQLLEEFEAQQKKKLDATLRKASLILKQVREAEKSHEVLEAIEDLKVLEPKLLVDEAIEPDADLVVGDHVRIMHTQQVGQLVEINKQQAIVDVRGMKMKVKLNQLKRHQVAKEAKKTRKPRSSVSVATTSPMRLEVNVIGMRVDEAMVEVRAFLDQAILNKLATGRIIHGHGTGALREASHEILKKHKAVKQFRLGGENEGGVGATVVTFK